MKTWLVSDWHCGEDRFDIMGRPFDDPKEMIELLIKNHNSKVAPSDLVYMLGDVCYQKYPQYLSEVARFNGTKRLIRGNHDRVFSDYELHKYFESVVTEGDGLDVNFGGVECYMTHYPTRGRKDKFNLVGHVHGAWKYQLNSFNVGVDVNHYYPVDAEKIPFHLKAITEFYDADVWVGYNEINSSHYDSRGKKTSYLPRS